jgi:predicted nucleic acid-binding protein
MRSGKPVYYWDSCLFIAWIADEIRGPGEMEGLAEAVAMVDTGKCFILTSVATVGEVLLSSLTTDAQEKFKSLSRNPAFTFADISFPISELASQIRDFYRGQQPQSMSVELPDAQHLATAIAYKEVDEFHTFDGDDLLRFNGNVAGFNLKICKPTAIQKWLF